MKFYNCPMCCNSGFTNQQDLKEHLLKASNPVNCPACLKSCKNVIYLIKHLDQCAASKSEVSVQLTRRNDEYMLNYISVLYRMNRQIIIETVTT